MSTYMNKVVGNLEQTRTGFTTKERTTARQNIDLNASLFTSSDNSLNFEDLDNDTKQINVTSDAYSLTSNTGINIVPNDTDKTIAINHATTTAADAAIVRVGKDVYGHVVLGTAITAEDFNAVTYTDAKKTTDSDKYIYLSNGVATEGRIVLDVDPSNSGLKLDSSKKYIQVNYGTNLAIKDGKLINTYTYTLPAATPDALGGIQTGYKTSDDAKKYAVELDDNKAYVNVPWTDTIANNGELSFSVATTSMKDGEDWVCTTKTYTFTADQATNINITTALAEYNHCHGALKYDGILSYAPKVTALGPDYISANPTKNVSLVLTTDRYITKSDISFAAGSNKILTQSGTWVDQYSYTLPAATSGALGGIKIGYTTTGKNYPVQLNTNNQAYVNVPWADTHCTTSMFVTTKDGTSDQIIAADTNKVYLALYDDTTRRNQHKIYGDGTIIKISSEAETGAGAAIKIDGSHNHGLLAQNGTLGQQSGFPGTTIGAYMTDNPSAKIEIPLAMTYKLTGSTWSTEYELTRGGIALSANGTRYLKEDGSWGTPTDTNSTTHLYAGASKKAANSAQTNGNVFLTVVDDTTARDSIKLVGSGGTTVTSDASGTVTITSDDILSISYSDDSSGKTGDVKSIDYNNMVTPDSHYNTMTLYDAKNEKLGRFYTLPTTMDKGILANTDATGVYPIPATRGIELYDAEDEETGLYSAYIGVKYNPNNMMIDEDGYLKRAYGVVRFQSIEDDFPRYTMLCTIKKRRALTGGAANMNISLLATYSGTRNTNPSVINLACRVQGSKSSTDTSDKAKYGITTLRFTEYRTNETNELITLVAQAYVNTSHYLIINIYAKCVESWHGVSISELHGAASYAMVPNDGGDYDITYYGYNDEQSPHPPTVSALRVPNDTLSYPDPLSPSITIADVVTNDCELVRLTHSHGNLSDTGVLSSSLSSFATVSSYLTANSDASIELAVAVTPSINHDTWDFSKRNLSGSGVFFTANSWSVLRQDGTWGGQPIEGQYAPYTPYSETSYYSPGRITSMYVYNTTGTGAQTDIKELVVNGKYYDGGNVEHSASSTYALIPKKHLLNDASRPSSGYKHGTLMINYMPVDNSRATETRFKVGGVCDAASANVTTDNLYEGEALLFDIGVLSFTIRRTYSGGTTIWARTIIPKTFSYLTFYKKGYSTHSSESTYSRSTGTINQGSKLSVGNFPVNELQDTSYCYMEIKLYIDTGEKTPMLYRIDVAHYGAHRYMITADCIECPTVPYGT